jgi:hypothetical protein
MRGFVSRPRVVLGMLCIMYLITYVDRVNISTAASENIDWSHACVPHVRDRFLYLSIANIRGVTSSR